MRYSFDLCLGFNGHLDTPVEILHVILLGVVKYLYRTIMSNVSDKEQALMGARWKAFDRSGLNIQAIQPSQMVNHSSILAGREFRTVVQAAPFVFFNHLGSKERFLWLLLGRLCSYVFQTAISDMKTYLEELKVSVNCFLNHLTSMTGQWTNKPKFHMLTHLVDSVERFGPPSLVSSERFESHNGVTRAASVHSNHLSPGRDIATSRNNERLLRALLSGATLYDADLQTHTRAGPAVRKLFQDKPHIQQMFGFNAKWYSKEVLKVNCTLHHPVLPPHEASH